MSSNTPHEWLSQHSKSEMRTGPAVVYAEVPSDETGHPGSQFHQQTFRQKWFGGIKHTLRWFTLIAVIVLITNVSWLFDARAKYGIQDGFGIIKRGSCTSIKSLNTWLHLAINILSTLLLTGSNAFMAVFSCPSRKEVDKAHRRGKFLRVGSFSLGNLMAIAKRKSLVVLILAISSVPFHLLYNSLVFSELSANEYYWTVVTEDFLTGAPFNLTGDWGNKYASTSIGTQKRPYFEAGTTPPNDEFGSSLFSLDDAENMKLEKVMDDYFKNVQILSPKWEKLSNKDCANAYSNIYLSSRRNVVLVSSTQNDTNSILTYGSTDVETGSGDGNWWICSEGGQDGGYMTCNPDDQVSSTGAWSVWDYPVEYCLSERIESTCSLNFSQNIMFVVIAFNALKVLMMIWVLYRYDAEQILVSVGDAAASFIGAQDPSTGLMCLANKREMKTFWQTRGLARPFTSRRRHWGVAVSKKRWTTFLFFIFFSFAVVGFFGVWSFVHLKGRGISLSAASLWKIGFGEPNQNTMVLYDNMKNQDVITMAIVSNIPQLLLAVVYLLYMGIMTTMFLAADWSNFAFKSQPLMVSTPKGGQRGTWMLGAPPIWGMSLLIVQTFLHWLVSQSLFVVKMKVYNKDGSPIVLYTGGDHPDYSQITNAGYSPIAIIFSIVLAGLLILSSIVFMFRRLPARAPPVVSTCTAAISASCHPSNGHVGMVYGEFMWGANGGHQNGVGHCSLVPVEMWVAGQAGHPVEGYNYAGFTKG